MVPRSIITLVNEVGAAVTGRAASVRQHIVEPPAPIVADARHHHVTTARLAVSTGDRSHCPEAVQGSRKAGIHGEFATVE